MNLDDTLQKVAYDLSYSAIPVLFAITVHEVAHGRVALHFGDRTAQMLGRLSLNPLKHIDPFGTLLLPALLILSGLPGFGYAKPVPINPYYFRGNKRVGLLITGLAGPTTNLVLAVVFGMATRIAVATGAVPDWLIFGLLYFMLINLVLLFFNLIPIPPFDGSRVLPLFLSDSAMRVYAQVERFGFIIIFAIIFLLPGLLDGYFAVTVDPVFRLLAGPAASLLIG
jgi:Zn-dependent protease